MSAQVAIGAASIGLRVLDTFGVFDSIKGPDQVELKLAEISDQLDALDQSISNGVFDIIDNGKQLAIISARADSTTAATSLVGSASLSAAQKATALSQAETGVTELANVINGILDLPSDLSPAVLELMVNALTHAMTVLAAASKVWSSGEFTGSGYNHGGLMSKKPAYDLGVAVIQKIEDQLTDPGEFLVFDQDTDSIFPNIVTTSSFKIAHHFTSDVVAAAFFENFVSETVAANQGITFGAGFVTVRMPDLPIGGAFGDTLAQIAMDTAKQFIDATINDAYYHFMTGLDQVPGSEFDSYSWYGDTPQSLEDLLEVQQSLVDGKTDALTGFGSGRTLNGTAEADFLKTGVNGDTLYGLAGDDYLQGQNEDDFLFGGEGNDVYAPGGGDDWIEDTGSGSDGDTVVLEGSFFDWDFYLINGQLNAIRGDLENPDERDILIGIEGVKFDDAQGPVQTIAATAEQTEIQGLTVTFVGGIGDDIFDVFDRDQVILEQVNEGQDSVRSFVDTYTLGANIENLFLSGPNAVTGIGNEGNNLIIGGLNDSRLFGQGGNDVLFSFSGNNILDGGAGEDELGSGDGADTLIGGQGNDVIDGATGEDEAHWDGVFANFAIAYDNSTDTFTITDLNANDAGGDEGIDTVSNVEIFKFGGIELTKAQMIVEAGLQENAVPGLASIESGGQVDENAVGGTVVATLTAVDAENDPLTFAITDSAGTEIQDSDFEIVGDEIRLASGANVDFETLNTKTLFIVVSDSSSSSGAQQISLTVNDLAETIQLGNGGVVLVDTGVAETRIIGGTGNDDITANSSGSMIDASGGDDIVRGSVGNDRILGSSGDDNLSGGFGADTLNGGEGNDTINSDGGNDRVFAGTGNDVVNGGEGNDLLEAKIGDDTINGDGGDDILRGSDGFDQINGGSGNDTAFGGNDNDTILGGIGDDTLDGNGGNDFIDGEDGDDTVVGGTGADVMLGGDGNDIMRGGGGADVMEGEDDNDLMFGSAGQDTMFGGNGNDVMEGNTQSDDLFGGFGNDILRGGDGFDFLDGGAGNDVLAGGNGNDVLVGGLGVDILRGNAQNDTYVFNSELDSTFFASDLIDGIEGVGAGGGDIIDLSGIDANTLVGGDNDFTFLGAVSSAVGLAAGAGSIWVENAGGQTRLYGNTDNDGVIEFAVRINDGVGITANDYTASDFIL